MTLPRTVADVLSEHVVFEVRVRRPDVPERLRATVAVHDRLVSSVHRQLGKPVASTAALAPVSEAFTGSVRSFTASCGSSRLEGRHLICCLILEG